MELRRLFADCKQPRPSLAHVGYGAAVIIRNSVVQQPHVRRKDCVRILRPLNRVAGLTPSVNVGVFNACSVGNKSTTINHWIANCNLRLAAVVETWHDSFDCLDLIACAPPGYHYIERARPQSATSSISTRLNHGGVRLFYHCSKCSVHARRVTFIEYSTFEFASAYVTGSALTILVIIVYRPGSAAVSEFFDELSTFLNARQRTLCR